jgi:capsular exopolysaccharide synthesis family protein
MEVIKYPAMGIKAISRLKLWEHPEFDPRIGKEPWYRSVLKAVGVGATEPTKEWTEDSLARAVYGKFASRLSVEMVRGSQLMTISFESADRTLAARVANGVAEEYIENDLETRYQMTRGAGTWLQERLTALREKLTVSERALQSYRESKGILDVKASAQGGAGQQFAEMTGRMVEARVKKAEAENTYNQIKAVPKGADLTLVPAIVRSGPVSDALKAKGDAERKLSEMGQRYGTEHPKYVQVEAELKAAKDNVRRQADLMAATIIRDYENAVATERAMSAALGQSRGAIQDINRNEFQLNVLEREVESNKQMYEMFMKRAKETSLSGDLQTPVARIVNPATPPVGAFKPDRQKIVLIALLVGLLVGAMISIIQDRMDNTLKSTDEVESKLKQPLLTSLPLLNEDESVAHMFLDKPESLYSEAIRTARTGVLLSAIDLRNRILLVTSTLPGEGKTSFSINLALAHAHTKKTLLIDADMRRPSIAKSMKLEKGVKGLSNLVSGTADFKECLHPVENSHLTVLPCGTIPPNPLELLLSDRFKATLDKLATVFDIIILDSPPVELVSDSLVIASHATGVIYVVKAESTPYQLARKGIKRLSRAEGNILGVVLNRLDFVKAEKYYGEYSGYGKYGYSKYGDRAGYSSYQSTYGADAQEEAKT